MTIKMKDSGIKWIGMIPEGWNVLKLKSCYSFGKGLSITKADLCEQGLGVISYGQVHSKDNIEASVRESLIRYLPFDHVSLSDNSRVSINDLIFADTSEDLEGCGNCIFIDSENVKYAGYHTIILHPKTKETSRYFGYLFTTDAWKTQIRENASGVKVYSITQDMLKNAYLLAPPIATQHKVVSYLDAKCAEIDALIAAKEKSNALLKEYRQSIIFEAVTKGLDPNVPMKDSGIEWIGMIPEGWKLIPLQRITNYNSQTLSEDTIDDFEFDYIDIGAVTYDKGIESFQRMLFKDSPSRARRIVQEDDIIVSTVRTYLKACAQIPNHDTPIIVSTGFLTLRAKNNIDNRFLKYAIISDSFVSEVEACSVGISYPAINATDAIKMKIAVPPHCEQIRIADYLDAKCAEIDVLIEANEKTINQLKEYRQSVIFEAVTGKMEV